MRQGTRRGALEIWISLEWWFSDGKSYQMKAHTIKVAITVALVGVEHEADEGMARNPVPRGVA
jgi:hypothetical protein